MKITLKDAQEILKHFFNEESTFCRQLNKSARMQKINYEQMDSIILGILNANWTSAVGMTVLLVLAGTLGVESIAMPEMILVFSVVLIFLPLLLIGLRRLIINREQQEMLPEFVSDFLEQLGYHDPVELILTSDSDFKLEVMKWFARQATATHQMLDEISKHRSKGMLIKLLEKYDGVRGVWLPAIWDVAYPGVLAELCKIKPEENIEEWANHFILQQNTEVKPIEEEEDSVGLITS